MVSATQVLQLKFQLQHHLKVGNCWDSVKCTVAMSMQRFIVCKIEYIIDNEHLMYMYNL